MSECPGLRPAWPYLFVRTVWCLGLSSFVSSSSLQLSFLCSCAHRWVPVSFPITCACRGKLSRWVLLLFSSYSFCSVVLCACVKLERLRLSRQVVKLEHVGLTACFRNLVGPPLAGVTAVRSRDRNQSQPLLSVMHDTQSEITLNGIM